MPTAKKITSSKRAPRNQSNVFHFKMTISYIHIAGGKWTTKQWDETRNQQNHKDELKAFINAKCTHNNNSNTQMIPSLDIGLAKLLYESVYTTKLHFGYIYCER